MDPWEDGAIDELLSSLSRWAGDQRAADAAAGRAREHWLRQQAGEASTLTGTLIDLAEQRAEVVVATQGRLHQGSVRAVGHDVVVLEHASGAVTLIALAAVQTIQLAPPQTGAEPSGSRSPAAGLSLAGLLDALAAERTEVRIELRGGNVVTGALRSVGADVMTIRVEGRPARSLQIPLDAVASCSL